MAERLITPLERSAAIKQQIVEYRPAAVTWRHDQDARCNRWALFARAHTDLLPIAVKGVPQGIPIFAVDAPPEIAAAYHLPPADGELPPGVAVWDAWIESFPRGTPEPIEPPGPIIYTSGTTGRPKGVRRHPPTPAQTLAWTKLVARAFGFDGVLVDQEPEHIVTVLTGPMYHSAPNAYGLLAVRAGADIILQPRFDPEELLRLIEQHRVTHLHMVPTMFVRLLKLSIKVRHKYDLSSLKFVVHAASLFREEVSAWPHHVIISRLTSGGHGATIRIEAVFPAPIHELRFFYCAEMVAGRALPGGRCREGMKAHRVASLSLLICLGPLGSFWAAFLFRKSKPRLHGPGAGVASPAAHLASSA
jgi:hypothetical protein